MTGYRIIGEVTTFLNDGGPAADVPVREKVTIWEGEHRPTDEELKAIAAGNVPPEEEYRQIFPHVVPLDSFMARNYPLANFEQRIRDDRLKVQRKRAAKLGWKTVQVALISELQAEQEGNENER
ncbi:MAG: hypothetical protein AAB896_01675 [Patescibacteria group bacterium]